MSAVVPKVVRFYNPSAAYGELSNYFVLTQPLVHCEKAYTTSEHLYQALKFLGTDASKHSRAYAERIRVAKTANMAKILARQKVATGHPWRTALNRHIEAALERGVRPRVDWEAVKVARMYSVLKLKFSEDLACRNVLLSTGNALLIEHTVNDAFWGNGGRDVVGENMLGKLLMRVRDELANESVVEPAPKRRIISIGATGMLQVASSTMDQMEKKDE